MTAGTTNSANAYLVGALAVEMHNLGHEEELHALLEHAATFAGITVACRTGCAFYAEPATAPPG